MFKYNTPSWDVYFELREGKNTEELIRDFENNPIKESGYGLLTPAEFIFNLKDL